MTESEVKLLFEKINKKKVTKEATQTDIKQTQPKLDDEVEKMKLSDADKLVQAAKSGKPLEKKGEPKNFDLKQVKKISDISSEVTEGKKKKKKYNPWAVCTSSVGRKDTKKYEDCVMGVKKKLKEGKNPYEYIIESKMEEIVESHLTPKISKKELIQIIQEKKMRMKKPTVLGGEIGEGETKEKEKVKTQPKTKPTSPNKNPSKAPHPAKAMIKRETMEGETETETAPTRTTPKTDPGTRPSHPGKKPNPDTEHAPAKAGDKDRIINAIMKLLGSGK